MTELSIQGELELELDQFKLSTGPFNFPLQGVTVLFGRSGSGKSTLLRAISGLDKRTRGVLQVGDVFWQAGKKSVKTSQRDIGFVFQDAALFPHMTVRENLLYGIKRLPKTLSPMDFDYLVQTAYRESSFNPAATSYLGARGLMQIMPATASTIAKGLEVSSYNLYDPETSIKFGTWHLHVTLEKYDNNVDAALAAYNGRTKVTLDDVKEAMELALPHRMRRKPFEPPQLNKEKLEQMINEFKEQKNDENNEEEKKEHENDNVKKNMMK